MKYFRSAFSAVFPLILFSLISIVYFGLDVITHLNTMFVGGVDSTISIWSFAWWKHCIEYGVNPVFNTIVWYPYKYNLVQQPGVGIGNFILAAPILFLFGPIVAFNISMLTAPAFAGWTAFFLLRYLTKSYWPSIIGAYFYGFSSYMVGHLTSGHLMLETVFLIPIIVLLPIKFYRMEMSNVAFCSLMGICLAFQCYLSCEIFAMVVFFGVFSLLLAFLICHDVKKLLRVFASILISLLFTLVLISPFLYFFFYPPQLDTSLIPPASAYFSDFLSPIIPPTTFMVSSGKTFGMNGFLSSYSDSYFGIPTLIILFLYFIEFRKEKVTKYLLILIVVIFISSLGSTLHFYGHSLFWMPWQLTSYLPLIKSALPNRLGLYLSLCVAVIIAYWITDSKINHQIKNFLIIISIIFLMPNLNYATRHWSQSAIPPKLISEKIYEKWLKPNDAVIVLPYASAGNVMLWQEQANMYFSLVGGYLGYTPKEFGSNPVVERFYQFSNTPNLNLIAEPGFLQATQQFLVEHQVKAIFVYNNHQTWKLFFQALGMSAIDVDGIDVYLTSQK